jgi:hypothetical protein
LVLLNFQRFSGLRSVLGAILPIGEPLVARMTASHKTGGRKIIFPRPLPIDIASSCHSAIGSFRIASK